MTATAIQVDNLGKQYRIGAYKERVQYSTLRDVISDSMSGFADRFRGGTAADTRRTIWALKDLNLNVQEGEVLGVIGRNGSGKSTLLKILSDIVEPTEGRAKITGRVASLLEVGTGFHGELTGRENVFLNGAILGMKQEEVRKNFDQIVDFSGIGQFIDTPVKRYSSGMYLRLAFAVAAHLEPEVLIVDEVLAVGDFEFQQKCVGRMREVGQSGRTVLFVSHSMAAVESLCSRCILLDGGRLDLDGEPADITREYRRRLALTDGKTHADLASIDDPGRMVKILQSLRIVDETGAPTSAIGVTRPFDLRIGIKAQRVMQDPVFAVRIDNTYGERLVTLRTPSGWPHGAQLFGEMEIACRIPEFQLAPGEYRIGVAVISGGVRLDTVNGALGLTVTEGDVFGEGMGIPPGKFMSRSSWEVVAT